MAADATPGPQSGKEPSFLSRLFSRKAQISVQLYSRTECPLCAEARETLLLLAGPMGFSLTETKIDHDQTLEDRYGLEVPVVLVDGQRHCFGTVDPARLKAAVKLAREQADRSL